MTTALNILCRSQPLLVLLFSHAAIKKFTLKDVCFKQAEIPQKALGKNRENSCVVPTQKYFW